MKVLGLTGGVGMGKSTCSEMLRAFGVPVVDTDDLARKVVEPGQPALLQIRQVLGAQYIDSTGRLRRGELARLVFADAAARQHLENILHPRIRELWRSQIKAWQAERFSLAAVVIPLLFETGAEKELDVTVCVACSAATQQRRLGSRSWSAQQVRQRIGAQLPTETKMAKADFVIWNEAGFEVHRAQLERILAVLQSGRDMRPSSPAVTS